MIIYDFPYRGPLQYEKFVLNYMQLSNEVTDLIEVSEDSEIHEYSKKIDRLFEECSSESSIALYSNFL